MLVLSHLPLFLETTIRDWKEICSFLKRANVLLNTQTNTYIWQELNILKSESLWGKVLDIGLITFRSKYYVVWGTLNTTKTQWLLRLIMKIVLPWTKWFLAIAWLCWPMKWGGKTLIFVRGNQGVWSVLLDLKTWLLSFLMESLTSLFLRV